jgi:hypothetical protein
MTPRVSQLLRCLVCTLLLSIPVVVQPQDSPDDPDAKCLKCHSRNLQKKLEDGAAMSLKIEGDTFSRSVHRVIGCTGCHRDVAKGKHPSREPIGSRRAYSLKHNRTCSQCHAARYAAWESSIHASLVAAGDINAPLCSDCHSSHAIQPRAGYEPVRGEPCSGCHEGIVEGYQAGVHGQAHNRGTAIREDAVPAPSCSDCHRAHEVKAVAAADFLRETCFYCHQGAGDAHRNWLPNASVHLRAVACAACHSPASERRIDLQLYDRATQRPLWAEDDDAEHRIRMGVIDSDGDGLDSTELRTLVRQTSRQGQAVEIVLRGRMEVTSGGDAHRIAPSGAAVRNCESCHQRESPAFQNVTVSIGRPDGRRHRFPAHKEVLTSVESIGSVGDFYAPGGTRIGILDWLVILAVLAGLAIPAGHFALGWYLRRRYRKR